MKEIKTIDSKNYRPSTLVSKLNELIRENNRQKDEIRQIKSKLRENAHYSRI